jgi:hypothetical protein
MYHNDFARGDGSDAFFLDRWFDPVEEAVRAGVRGFIEELLETELDGVLHRSP